MILRPGSSPTALPKVLTPTGGMVLALGLSGMLWSGVALGMHIAGAF